MSFDLTDLDLLPDRPAQAELQKLRKAAEHWLANGPGAPPRAMGLAEELRRRLGPEVRAPWYPQLARAP